MASSFGSDYLKMLRASMPLPDGPCKNAIDALEDQIEFHTGEIYRLKSVQNSRLPVSGMPTELLSEVFCYLVECGVSTGRYPEYQTRSTVCDKSFAIKTFSFRQVCKHWNEVAVSSPRLWVWWVAGATKAWPLFHERSKGAPISLTWRYSSTSAPYPGISKDAALMERIRLLDFYGEDRHFESLFGALESTHPFNASSIRLQILPYDQKNSQDHLVRFFSLSFPNLSKLDVRGFLPDPSSPVFTTSILTSLKLSFSIDNQRRYTLAQFSRILQKHPNLQKLDLEEGVMPRVDPSEVPVQCTLPQLVDLTLGSDIGRISGFLGLVDMSSPLYNIVLRLRHPRDQPVTALVNALKKVLTVYYKSGELNRPRNAADFTVEWRSLGDPPLVFDTKSAKSRSAPASAALSALRLEFWGVDEPFQLFTLFPLNTVQRFTANGLYLPSERYRTVLQKMKHLLHLHLVSLNISHVLEAMGPSNQDEQMQEVAPQLVSLTLSSLDLLGGVCDALLLSLQSRRDKKMGLRRLAIHACRVHSEEDLSELKEVVKEVQLVGLEEVCSEDEEEEETDSDDDMFGGSGHCYGCYHGYH